MESEKINLDMQNKFMHDSLDKGRNTLPVGSKPIIID